MLVEFSFHPLVRRENKILHGNEYGIAQMCKIAEALKKNVQENL